MGWGEEGQYNCQSDKTFVARGYTEFFSNAIKTHHRVENI